jgi:hypothetical protein
MRKQGSFHASNRLRLEGSLLSQALPRRTHERQLACVHPIDSNQNRSNLGQQGRIGRPSDSSASRMRGRQRRSASTSQSQAREQSLIATFSSLILCWMELSFR